MDNPEGRVVSVSAGTPQASVVLDVDASAVCPRCAAGRGCGAGIFAQTSGSRRRISAALDSRLSVSAGDTVRVALQPSNVLLAAFIVYGYPLIAAVGAASLAWALELSDLIAAVFALFGMMLGALLARWRLASNDCLQRLTPVVVERLRGGAQT